MSSLRGTWIAPQALRWLANPVRPRIHTLFNQSVNLIDQQGSLLSVVLPSLGPAPFAIVAESEGVRFEGFQELELNSRVELLSGQLQIGGIGVQFSEAETWNPNPDWTRLSSLLDQPLILELQSLLGKHAPQGSFAPLVAGIERPGDQSVQSKALRAAVAPSQRLLKGLEKDDLSQISAAAGELAGLGGGVTPSGDDYLLGAIYALWTRLPTERAKIAAAAVANPAVERTNAISAEWLKSAARGEAAEDWHKLAKSLGTETELEPMAVRLIRRGHTSGADAMAGFVSALNTLG